MTDDELKQQKDIQFYGSAVNAWIGTALEVDKSLLALSAAALGLVVTLLTTKVGTESAVLLILYIAAMVAFLICIASVLVGLHKSKLHLEHILTGKGQRQKHLDAIDAVSRCLFGIGATLLTIIGIWTAVLLYAEKGNQVSNERITREGTVDLGKSLSGIENLRPGAGSAPAQTPAPSPASPPASPPAQQSTNTTGSGASGTSK